MESWITIEDTIGNKKCSYYDHLYIIQEMADTQNKYLPFRIIYAKIILLKLGVFFVVSNYICLGFLQIHDRFSISDALYSTSVTVTFSPCIT